MDAKRIYCIVWPEARMSHKLKMTDEGFRLIHWLIDHNYLASDVEIKQENDNEIYEI